MSSKPKVVSLTLPHPNPPRGEAFTPPEPFFPLPTCWPAWSLQGFFWGFGETEGVRASPLFRQRAKPLFLTLVFLLHRPIPPSARGRACHPCSPLPTSSHTLAPHAHLHIRLYTRLAPRQGAVVPDCGRHSAATPPWPAPRHSGVLAEAAPAAVCPFVCPHAISLQQQEGELGAAAMSSLPLHPPPAQVPVWFENPSFIVASHRGGWSS